MPIKGECVYNDEVPNTLHGVPMPEINPVEVPEDEGPEEVPDESAEVPDEDHEYVPFVGYNEQEMIEAYYSGEFPARCFSPDFIRRMEDDTDEEN